MWEMKQMNEIMTWIHEFIAGVKVVKKGMSLNNHGAAKHIYPNETSNDG